MKRVNWKLLKSQIPHRVQIGKRVFEILWVDDFADGKTLGETRFDPPQIVIKTGESDKLTVKIYAHELVHAISDEEEVGLTETQVLKLEHAMIYLLKPNNVFEVKK